MPSKDIGKSIIQDEKREYDIYLENKYPAEELKRLLLKLIDFMDSLAYAESEDTDINVDLSVVIKWLEKPLTDNVESP